jgi:hypothetical protein
MSLARAKRGKRILHTDYRTPDAKLASPGLHHGVGTIHEAG